MNNYEKIKAMSIDEMLEFFTRHCSCDFCIMSNKKPYQVEIDNRQCKKDFNYRNIKSPALDTKKFIFFEFTILPRILVKSHFPQNTFS